LEYFVGGEMIVYNFELLCIVINILGGFNSLKHNHKVLAIINFVLAAILIILTVILAVQDIKAYFYNKEIRKKYEGEK
jgi:arginine exporter protein ArgO